MEEFHRYNLCTSRCAGSLPDWSRDIFAAATDDADVWAMATHSALVGKPVERCRTSQEQRLPSVLLDMYFLLEC